MVGDGVTVVDEVMGTDGNGISVSIMTKEAGVWFVTTGFPIEFPEIFRKKKPATMALMMLIAMIAKMIVFKRAGAWEGFSSPTFPASVPSGVPHWPQNLSGGFAGAPQEGQERNRNHRFSLYTPFPGG